MQHPGYLRGFSLGTTMIRTKDIMASLPLVASALGDKYGVNVIIGGDQAYTDGKTINLPTLPLDCDAELLALARAFIDHESSHIRHTDFEALRDANLTPVEKHLWNCLEDWRCENSLAAIYPGCRQHFRWLIQHHFGNDKDDDRAGDDSPALSVLNYVLLSVRAWDVPSVGVSRDKEATVVSAAFPGLIRRLDAVLSRVRSGCRSTRDAIGYALELAAVIEEYSQQPPKTPDAQSGASEGGDGQHRNGNSAGRQSDNGPDNPAEKHREKSSDDSGVPDSPDASGAPTSTAMEMGETADNACASQAEGRTSADIRGISAQPADPHTLKDLLQASAHELPRHLGERLAETLSAQRASDARTGLNVAHEGRKFSAPLPDEHKKDALRSCVALRARLHGLLQARLQQPCIPGRRGTLNPQRLYALSVHNPRVFFKRGEKRQVSTAVHLLLDCSGSMRRKAIQLASQACYAVALALERCQGVNVGVTAFPADGIDPEACAVAPLVRHGQRVHDNFRIYAGGYTPLAEALWWVMQRMHPLRETRKIILILSDGAPDSVPAARHAVQQAAALGFEVMGLGIQDDSMATLLPTASRTIMHLSDLAPALFGMLQQTLLRRP